LVGLFAIKLVDG